MTDETERHPESDRPEEPSASDPRFEVKWQKKSHSQPTVESARASDETSDLEQLRRELEEERQRTQLLQERWQRAAADLVNLRKRTEQEQGEREKFASLLLVYELLPVLDNFERALATIPGNLAMLTWIQGIMLVQRQIQAILEHQGLVAIEAQGQTFDPSMHEAIGERETTDVTPGTVVQEYQRGYSMHGRVIRPALVEVAKEPADSTPSEAESTPASNPDARADAAPDPAPAHDGSPDVAAEAQAGNVGP